MDNASIIYKYFNNLSDYQKSQFAELGELYNDWNSKINVVSRKDLDHLYERHVLHSLGIARTMSFKQDTRILDVGTGGGFPGIPLAIMFPDAQFHMIDSIGKKIKVVKSIIQSLDLQNSTAEQIRVENVKEKYDFVVSRAVTRMKPFYSWVSNKISEFSFNEVDNGILYLKGGEVGDEMIELNRPFEVFELKNFYKEEFFETKKVIYITN